MSLEWAIRLGQIPAELMMRHPIGSCRVLAFAVAVIFFFVARTFYRLPGYSSGKR